MSHNKTVAASLLALAVASPSWAQTVPSAPAPADATTNVPAEPNVADVAQGNDAGEIVVTARRRNESLSKVPIAISVLGGEALIQQSIRSEADLQSAVPGLVIRQTGSNNAFNYAIRGQSIDAYSNSAPGVLPYINDVQVNTLGASSFYDIENIQVLKGPQGTLFGRNATGGAVLYQLATPGDEFKGFVSARYGNFDTRQLTAAVTLPIAQGVSLRLAGNLQSGGGFVRNLFDGKRLGGLNDKSVRGTLRLGFAESWTNTTTVQYTRDRGLSTPTEIYSFNACGATNAGLALNGTADCLYNPSNPAFRAFLAANPGAFAGGIAGAADLQRQLGPWKSNIDGSTRHTYRDVFAINRTEIELSPLVSIKNIIGFNRGKRGDSYDFDGTPYLVFHTQTVDDPQLNDTRQFSEELQLQGRLPGDRLTYVLGLYYLDQRDIQASYDAAFGFAPVAPAAQFLYASTTRDRSLAAFVQATYRPMDKVSLTGGLRYTRDRLSSINSPDSIFGPATQKMTQKKPSWTASVDYQPTSSLLVYAATRGSWRTGGYNFTSVPLDLPSAIGGNAFAPETTQDIELGVKFNGSVGGVPTTLNVAAFNQWVHDAQRAAFVLVLGNSALVTNNVPEAEVTGAEASLTIRPARWFNAGASLTYVNARFTKPDTLALGVPLTFGPYADTPRWSGSVYAEATRPLSANAGTVTLRGDLFAQSSSYFSNLADTLTPNTRIPGYPLVNGRLSWASIFDTGLTAAVYVRNLFEKRYYAGGLPSGSGFGINSVSPGQPRTFGAELRLDF